MPGLAARRGFAKPPVFRNTSATNRRALLTKNPNAGSSGGI